MNKAALDASSQPLQSAHLLTNRVAARINQQSKGSRMKRMLLLLSLVPAIAFSSTPFDADVDDMYIMSSIPLIAFSSGAATVCSSTPADAPG